MEEIETIFAIADVDGDGQVSMGEFVQMLCPSTASGSGNWRKQLNVFIPVWPKKL